MEGGHTYFIKDLYLRVCVHLSRGECFVTTSKRLLGAGTATHGSLPAARAESRRYDTVVAGVKGASLAPHLPSNPRASGEPASHPAPSAPTVAKAYRWSYLVKSPRFGIFSIDRIRLKLAL